MAVAATAWIGRDLSQLAAQPVVFGLAYLAFALAVAVRFGAIPFHVWAARLTESVPETALPIVTAWGPAAFAVVALGWADASIAPLLVEMDAERSIVLVLGIASIALAAFAAWIQDDLEHVVGYSIIGDAGVVLLALAALDTEAWEPARLWILSYVVARSAFAGWAAAMRATFFTSRIADLRGWALRSPVLTLAFGAIVVAGVGLPGLAAFDARARLVDIAVGEPFHAIVLLATFAPLAYYGRLLAIGLMRPDPGLPDDGAMPGLPRLTSIDLTDPRGSFDRAWTANRPAVALVMTLMLAGLSVAVSAGGFDARAAAGALGPGIEGPSEPSGAAPGPSDAVSAPPSESPSGSAPSD
jgi:NADH:ubiquinone oxidoreductase subunit 2 (subunit N)